jgi:hypothetical protein
MFGLLVSLPLRAGEQRAIRACVPLHLIASATELAENAVNPRSCRN